MRRRSRTNGAAAQEALNFEGSRDPFAPDDTAASGGGAPNGDGGTGGRRFRDGAYIDGDEIRSVFGHSLTDLLDLDQWPTHADPADLIRSVTEQVRRVVARDRALRGPLRRRVQELLATQHDKPGWAGFHAVAEPDLQQVARGWLFNGRTEAVCGDFLIHNTIPLAIAQAGVCVVGYSGRHDQWHQRIIRRELEIDLDDPVAEVEAALESRDRLGRPDIPNRLEQLNELARRGFVSYMERQVMARQCPGRWRIGYGHPTPLELLTGMGNMELLQRSLDLLRQLLLEDTRWIFVSRASREPAIELIGKALEPLEFVLLFRQHSRLREQVRAGHYPERYRRMAEQFVEDVGRHIVMGVFRAGPMSPAWIFYAHEERAYQAALIAMADALALQPQGFPALVQLARVNCRAALGGSDFEPLVMQAYQAAGEPGGFYRGDVS